jgi:hypothetical protein
VCGHSAHIENLIRFNLSELFFFLFGKPMKVDLRERIKNAKKTYFMLQKFFKNKNGSKKLK